MCTLTPNRKPFLVAKATVGTDIDQPLDVHCNLLSKITFHLVAVLDHVADCCNLTFREVTGFNVATDIGLITIFPAVGRPMPKMYVARYQCVCCGRSTPSIRAMV